MIKVETLGMMDHAKNAVFVSDAAVKNNSLMEHEGELYLIDNLLTGDDAYCEDVVLAAGEKLNGYMIKAWEGEKLLIDEKHIAYASEKSYADLVANTTVLGADEKGGLKVLDSAPVSGVYFKVVEKVLLTEKAVKVIVKVA